MEAQPLARNSRNPGENQIPIRSFKRITTSSGVPYAVLHPHGRTSLCPPSDHLSLPPECQSRGLLPRPHQCPHIPRRNYRCVDSPIEAPGKDTYGDVDILVFGPLEPPFNEQDLPLRDVAAHLAMIIEAKDYIVEKGNHTMNFAIPWPKSLKVSDIPCESTSNSEAQDTTEEKYIQLDIKICPSLKIFNWELFHAAHGDLWNILGSTIRKFGLTVNNLRDVLEDPRDRAV